MTTAPVKVVVRFKMAMSTEPAVVEIDWRPGWPIPQINDAIIAGGHAGRVMYVDYDHDAGVIKINAT